MPANLKKLINGYLQFHHQYVEKDNSHLQKLAADGQNPEAMIVACCDSRVDPALLFQCKPGDLFVIRNVANLVPPYEVDEAHHGTSAALEFGICYLHIKHLIILGHSECGGIQALMNRGQLEQNDFIGNWMDLVKIKKGMPEDINTCAKLSLINSYQNCLTFPWIKEKHSQKTLFIHLWFFDIKSGTIFAYQVEQDVFSVLNNTTYSFDGN